MTTLMPLEQLAPQRFETPVILKKLALASRVPAKWLADALGQRRQSVGVG